ncbi:MAG: NUDIX hydrolase [Actinobacteria bacterium]|nr:NUDIX hydrolase [Actinomycetota bacterium]
MELETQSISAAGAVLWRRDGNEVLLIALIHRPRYDDWSLPKGKLDEGETHISCAYREVLEETGYSAVFGPELGTVIYDVAGTPKIVRYWSAKAEDEATGTPDPKEVDFVEWFTPVVARKKLTLDDDRSVVDFFLEFGPDTTPVVLLRHAKAVKRSDWDGDDEDRPLDQVGQRQAQKLINNFHPYRILQIHSSDAQRCLETVAPLSKQLGAKKRIVADLSEYRYATDTDAAANYAHEVLVSEEAAIICSHNPILPKLLKRLIGKKNFKELDAKLNPGDAWVLHHRDGEIIAIDAVPAPVF